MSSTTQDGAYCSACRVRRPAEALILVSPVDGRTPYCVCRASVSGPCFRSIGPASSERIQLLANYIEEPDR